MIFVLCLLILSFFLFTWREYNTHVVEMKARESENSNFCSAILKFNFHFRLRDKLPQKRFFIMCFWVFLTFLVISQMRSQLTLRQYPKKELFCTSLIYYFKLLSTTFLFSVSLLISGQLKILVVITVAIIITGWAVRFVTILLTDRIVLRFSVTLHQVVSYHVFSFLFALSYFIVVSIIAQKRHRIFNTKGSRKDMRKKPVMTWKLQGFDFYFEHSVRIT